MELRGFKAIILKYIARLQAPLRHRIIEHEHSYIYNEVINELHTQQLEWSGLLSYSPSHKVKCKGQTASIIPPGKCSKAIL